MKRLVAMVVAAGAAVAAVAMPTKAELQKAQTMVNDVTAADVAALKAKSKTPAEVAAKHMELAGQSGSEAEKYLLLQGAFKLYAKAGDYDAAANVIEKLQAEITDYNPEVTVELCGAEFIRKMRENAPRLYALKENARRIVFYRKQLPIREAAVKKNPKDPQTQRKLAECHAELGDWPKALEVFVQAGGEFKKMAEGETNGKVPAQELGDFWWDYETKSDTPIYKLHAAELYRKALADDSFKGLARTRTEQRVKDADKVAVDLPRTMNACGENGKGVAVGTKPMSFELTKGINLELLHCPAGTFKMSNAPGGPNGDGTHEVKLTRTYWIASSCVTWAMYKAFEADYDKDEKKDGEKKPDGLVTGYARAEAFASWLNKRFQSKLPRGYVFRLPSEAEWEYAMNTGVVARNWDFEGTLDTVRAVSGKANAWKFEVSVMDYAAAESDPVRVYSQNPAWVCRQDAKKRFLLRMDGNGCFRMVVGPDLIAEKTAKK